MADPLPKKWTALKPNEPLEAHRVYGTHLLYYKIAAQPGATLSAEIEPRDDVVLSVDGKFVQGTPDKYQKQITFTLPGDAKEVVALYENRGHYNYKNVMELPVGLCAMRVTTENLPLEISEGGTNGKERDYSLALSRNAVQIADAGWKPVAIETNAAAATDALLTWYRMQCELPAPKPGVWGPWHLHLEANGNGFIYVNGRCIGRNWQAGPQHDFYIPETWLNFGEGKTNTIVLNLRPLDKGVCVQAARMQPASSFAEFR